MTTDLTRIKMAYGIIGRDPMLDRVLDTALQVAPTNLSVLIEGESGVGKEIIPRIIHDNSLRKNKRYIAINCGSIPEGTIDSELFGHVKGSFTGAIADHDGYFGAANGGTLFLDEVGELPLSTQVRLLRVLETGEYVPVGSNEPRKTDVRIVAATNVQMQQAIRNGRFREDLYYRLCTINVKMPALRERGNDIVLLFKHFAHTAAQTYKIPKPLQLTPEAEQVMVSYQWPGNIRQLRNKVEQMSILCENRSVTPEILRRYDIVPGHETTVLMELDTPQKHNETLEQTIEGMKYAIVSLKKDVELLKGILHVGANVAPQPIRELPSPEETFSEAGLVRVAPAKHSMEEMLDAEEVTVMDDDDLNVEKMERNLIVKALRKAKNRRKVAANLLGMSERTLYRKIEQYGLDE